VTSVVHGRRWPVLLAVAAGCAVGATSASAAGLQPSGTLTARPAKIIHLKHAANIAAPKAPKGVAINRPTMSFKAYRAAKAAAGSHHAMARALAPVSPAAPTVAGFNGIQQSQSDGWFPPDVNGSISRGNNVLITNDRYTAYSKSATPTLQFSKTLNTLFGYGTESMFDPRVLWDPQYNRWVASSDAFEESSTTQILALGISRGGNPASPEISYLLNGKGLCGNNVFVDYPQESMTQDAIIVTVNCFDNASGNYTGSRIFAVAKAILYNGLGFSVPVFAENNTATPPNVIDQNPTAHIMLAGGTAAVQDAAFNNPQAGFYSSMNAPATYSGWFTPSVPPSARQAGCSTTSCQIDTSDGRFVSPSTQYGNSLWNVTTYANVGFAEPYWGEFNTSTHGMNQSGTRFLSSNSDDWNASLVADTAGDMWMDWSSSSPTANPSMVVAARKSADAAGSTPNMLIAKQSTAELTGDFDSNFGVQRWGDTSQITQDPQKPTQAWAWNEWVPDSANWGTFGARFNNP
jgi:hypothetical protein